MEAQRQLIDVVLPFMRLWEEMESYTSGDGYLDKLCMELVGPAVEPLPPADARCPRPLPGKGPRHARGHRGPARHRLTPWRRLARHVVNVVIPSAGRWQMV